MDNILNNLGLCMRSRGLVTGEEIVCEEMKKGHVYLVFLANDAGANTTKTIQNKAKFYNVEIITKYSSYELSQAIGKINRMVIGVTNKSFIKILK